ncbi:MAG: hypothetical protein ACREDT_16175, partial [Methylocella sp.]
MIDDQAPTIEPDTPTPITDNPPTSTHLQQPSSTGPVNGHKHGATADRIGVQMPINIRPADRLWDVVSNL